MKRFVLFFSFVLLLIGNCPKEAFAYYTNMPATIVVGQPDFVSGSINQGGASPTARSLRNGLRGILVDSRGRLIVSDGNNNRVLIWNSIPTQNNTPADIVLGQPDFTSSTANNGGRSAATLSAPFGLASDGTRLFVADSGNQRALVWNNLPTTNQQPADVVVGQADMTTGGGSCDGSHSFNSPSGIAVYNGKLMVSDGTNPASPNRILIWNTIP